MTTKEFHLTCLNDTDSESPSSHQLRDVVLATEHLLRFGATYDKLEIVLMPNGNLAIRAYQVSISS